MPIGDLLAQISGEAPAPSPIPTHLLSTPSHKRKAEDGLERTNDKQVRKEQTSSNTSRPISQIKKPTDLDKSSITKPPSRLNATAAPFMPKTGSSTTAGRDANTPASPAPAGPVKAPKKGSFAEIMARGKVAQASFGQVGKIQHKRIEKSLSKKERQEIKDQSRGGPIGKPRPTGTKAIKEGQGRTTGNGKSPTKRSADLSIPEKRIKKAALATTGYTGTARPLSSATKSKPSSAQHPYRKDSSSHRYTYADEDDEDEDDEEEYYSDASSDMEAAAFEVDEEEERAARIARKEDELALAEENRHKREKEEKRRRLAAMAKSRR